MASARPREGRLRAVTPPAPSSPTESQWDALDISPEGHALPLLPPGEEIQVIVTGGRVVRVFDSWRAVLTCQVLGADGLPRNHVTEDGEVVPFQLSCFFKLPPRRDRRNPKSAFEPVSRGSKYYRHWVLANRGLKPLRRNRMSLEIFGQKVFHARLGLVITDRNGHELPKELQHNVVQELVGLA